MAIRPFRNLGLKFAALGLGTLLWFTITGEQVERKVTRVPILYRNLPADLEITDQPDSVDVSIRGKYADISRTQDITLTADLGAGRPGANVLPLRVDQVSVPPGVQVTQIDPGTVTVYLEKSGAADVPVRPFVDGEPAPGFVVREVRVEPATVTVVGPQSRFKPTTFAVTERIAIDGLRKTHVQDVSVGVGDAQLRLRQPRTARVTVVIEPAQAARTLANLPVAVRGLRAGRTADLTPPRVGLTVSGRADAVDAVAADAVRLFIDVTGRAPGEYSMDVRAELPEGLSVGAIVPPVLIVRIR